MDDLIIIGAGWAGLAAAAFALEKGARVRVVAQGIGTPVVTPAWISVWDSAEGDLLAAVRALAGHSPDHPYALAGADALAEAVESFRAIGQRIGLPHSGDLAANRRVLTALGTWQRPALVPPGYSVDPGESPLFVGFVGWRDYYPALSGPNAQSIDLPIAARPWDLTPTQLAREFDAPSFRAAVAGCVRPLLNGATAVGFPAVLGLEDPVAALADLSQQIGLPVFELPTLPPSVPGTRLFNKMRRYLLDHGVRLQIGHPAQRGLVEAGRAVGVEVAAVGKPASFRAGAVILATGGLYGGGLFSDDRGRVWEPLFGIPVAYDPDRTRWFNDQMLDPAGHPVHHFGIRVSPQMQPLDAEGAPFAGQLYAAGRILAQPQAAEAPAPLEAAEGISLATAYRAVASALAAL